MNWTRQLAASLALAALSLPLVSSTAWAARDAACQNIEIGAQANCEVKVSGGCTAQCTPVSIAVRDGQQAGASL